MSLFKRTAKQPDAKLKSLESDLAAALTAQSEAALAIANGDAGAEQRWSETTAKISELLRRKEMLTQAAAAAERAEAEQAARAKAEMIAARLAQLKKVAGQREAAVAEFADLLARAVEKFHACEKLSAELRQLWPHDAHPPGGGLIGALGDPALIQVLPNELFRIAGSRFPGAKPSHFASSDPGREQPLLDKVRAANKHLIACAELGGQPKAAPVQMQARGTSADLERETLATGPRLDARSVVAPKVKMRVED
jgi:hypothetical protein